MRRIITIVKSKINKNSYFGNILYSTGIWMVYHIKRIKLRMQYVKDIIKAIIKSGKVKKLHNYPETIQLPITYKCNFNCIMCGMHNICNRPDFSSDELGKILSDKLFERITTIGLNGGEPFLKPDLIDCVRKMIKLPKLEEINIISNGFFTNTIVDKLYEIHELCSAKGIKVNLSLSVDGVGDTQDFMRGKKDSWINVNKTINQIKGNKHLCDKLGIICTITKHNIYNIGEVELWARRNKLLVSYNIATVNNRIDNHDRVENFSVFNDALARKMTQEFFYKKAIQEKSQKYYGLYLYVRYHKRYSMCKCQNNSWVTLTPNGQISYCATHSDELGDAKKVSAYNIFNGNIKHLKRIKKTYCNTCSHYMQSLNVEGLKLYYHDLLDEQKIMY